MNKKAPSWQTIRTCNIVIVTICIPIAVVAGPSWASMIDCAIIGAMLATIYLVNHFIKMQADFNELSARLTIASEINSHLIKMYVNRPVIKSPPPLEPPDAPRIH